MRLAALVDTAAAPGCGDAALYRRQAAQVAASIDALRDPHGPLWLAASHDNALPDVWGRYCKCEQVLVSASRCA
jgi:hypothetical protein